MATLTPRASFDGGELDCGSGLLLLIRRHIDPLAPGELLELRSRERSVIEDLPSWCRLTGNDLVEQTIDGVAQRYLICKGRFVAGGPPRAAREPDRPIIAWAGPDRPVVAVRVPTELPAPAPAPAIAPLSVMGMGSWPRPPWMLRALHDHLEGRLDQAALDETADDAVRLAVEAQLRAGVDVVTDGEQRRDSYASFVGARLDNCQLIPITDLLPLVEHPEELAAELLRLDVPAEKVRHPAVFGPLARSRPLAAHELAFVRTLTSAPVKVALPGPYLLTRTMWMECISDRAYATRETLAADLVRVLREEIHALLAGGAALVQLDEPVLSEVILGRPVSGRSFMCGALGERLAPKEELAFAQALITAAVAGLPRERLAVHVCRGNWTPDENAALAGDFGPLLDTLAALPVGTLFLEAATARAGDLAVLAALPRDKRLGIGVVDQKTPRIETVDELRARAERAAELLGADRILLTPDCGFATFADNPIAAAPIAEGKLAALVAAARLLRGHGPE